MFLPEESHIGFNCPKACHAALMFPLPPISRLDDPVSRTADRMSEPDD